VHSMLISAFLLGWVYHQKVCRGSAIDVPRGVIYLVSVMLIVSCRQASLHMAHCFSLGHACTYHMKCARYTGHTLSRSLLSLFWRSPYVIATSLMPLTFAYMRHLLRIFICQSSYSFKSYRVFMRILSPSLRRGEHRKPGISRQMS
jgi:hypothetical protein